MHGGSLNEGPRGRSLLGFFLPQQSGENSRQPRLTDASRHTHCPDAFKCWLSGGVQDLAEPVVEELLLGWLYSFLTVEEKVRLVGWHLGVSL